MSGQRKIAGIGELFSKTEAQRIADVAMHGDDRALEILVTPGATQKKILPLSEETSSINPTLLVVGKDTDATIANGVVRLRPAHFLAGILSGPYDVGIGAKQKVNLDSAVFGNNSSGSTRTDLLYATISFGTLTSVTKPQKPLGGGAPSSQSQVIAADPLVTLGIVAGVAAGSPLASLPADAGDGSSYNFGLAALAIPNLYAGTALNQSVITPLWSRGWIQPQRIQTRLSTMFSGAAAEKLATPYTSRWGALQALYVNFRILPGTSSVVNGGPVIDNSIDWRNRLLMGFVTLLPIAANTGLDTVGADVYDSLYTANNVQCSFTGPGTSVAHRHITCDYHGVNQAGITCYTDGTLHAFRSIAPVDATNGDNWAGMIFFTDQFKF